MDDADDFVGWLNGRLAEHGISQRQLARRAGVNHATISRLARGNRLPTHRTARRLAAVLDPLSAQEQSVGPAALAEVLRRDPWLVEHDIARIVRFYDDMRRVRMASRGARAQ